MMKRMKVLIICIMMMCIRISFAEEGYHIKDFTESKLFADQFGCIPYDSVNGYHTAATYEEITKEFPGAVDRYYECAPEIRRILYRIPLKIGESSVYWSNSRIEDEQQYEKVGYRQVLCANSTSLAELSLHRAGKPALNYLVAEHRERVKATTRRRLFAIR